MTNTKAYVKFSSKINMKGMNEDLRKELAVVEGILNLTPSARNSKTKNWEANPTNIAVMNYADLTVRKIKGMVDQGLSFQANDYYVYVQFGGKPSITKSPNGMIKAMAKLASLQGYTANINVGCIFEGYQHLQIKRNGLIDKIELVNSAESEIRNADIVAPYAVVTLMRKDGSVVYSKVTIIRNNEYLNAKNQGSATHRSYPVPMAQKVALKRAAEEVSASLGIDDSVELELLRGEITDHNNNYQEEKEAITEQSDTLTVDAEIVDAEETVNLDDL